jgi:hypothetical protein
MSDVREDLEAALAKAAEYDRLARLATDPEKREECRTRAKFYRDIIEELRAELIEKRVA